MFTQTRYVAYIYIYIYIANWSVLECSCTHDETDDRRTDCENSTVQYSSNNTESVNKCERTRERDRRDRHKEDTVCMNECMNECR